MKCVNCNQELREGASFCTFCGTEQPIAVAKYESLDTQPDRHSNPVSKAGDEAARRAVGNDINIRSNYLYWNISSAELVRVIDESEISDMSGVRGICVNNGTIARIYSNGELVTTIKGGKYDFAPSEKLDELITRKFGGFKDRFINGPKRFLINLVLGKSLNDKIEEDAERNGRNLRTIDDAIKLVGNAPISIVLYQDRDFELVLGKCVPGSGMADYTPITIDTPHFDLRIGVNALFRIKDIDMVLRNYLQGHTVLRTEQIARILSPLVESSIQRHLSDFDPTSEDMSHINNVLSGYAAEIERDIRSVDLYGISLVNILKVTAENEDIKRFRNLSRELYLSEEELNYLHRTNEFKNRLRTATNQQLLLEASSDNELNKSLMEINKDKILNEDELDRFYVVLSRERRIFNAQDHEKEERAIAEILKTGLIREEDLEILRHEAELRRKKRLSQESLADTDIAANQRVAEYTNDFALKLMQLKDSIDYERTRISAEADINRLEIINELDIANLRDEYSDKRYAVEFKQQQERDDYNISLQRRQHELEKENMEFLSDLAQKEQRAQAERLKLIHDMKAQEERAAREHEENKLNIQANKELETIKIKSTMSAEQLAAEQLNTLDAAAQAAYFTAGKDLEQERALRAEANRMNNEMLNREMMRNAQFQDALMAVNANALDKMAHISANMIENRNEMKNEYRDRLEKEQLRHDMHQDRALNYTTRMPQPTSSQPAVQQPQTAPTQATSQQTQNSAPKNIAPDSQAAAKDGGEARQTIYWCPNPECRRIAQPGEKFCEKCGTEVEPYQP